MKAVILAAGKGTRMRPLTFTRPKHMLPVAGKPILEHIVNFLRAGGINELVMVIGSESEYITEYFGDGARFDVSIEYAEQRKPLGLAHAVSVARDLLEGEERFITVLGDVLFKLNLKDVLSFHLKREAKATIAISEAADPTLFGVVKVADGFRIERLVEKPKVPPSNLIIAGLYVFENEFWECVNDLKPSWRGEYEITDAVQLMVDRGYPVYGYLTKKWWKDTGRPTDLLEASQKFLSELSEFYVLGEVQREVEIRGPVQIGRDTVIYEGAKIFGPTVIGERCEIGPGCIIGPNVEIGSDVKLIENVELRNAIVMSHTLISNNVRITDSIIGEGCRIGSSVRASGDSKVFGVVIGDNSVIGPGISFSSGSMLGPNSSIKLKWEEINNEG
ncbi:MAG: glucose-1-phosphate thymidylyltransferase [Candidatus Freyarchaeota archaeon]|nr:glucose-1-phosphate thymidylyltransferase [Candidatus Jordarchaeia archaeon]